ncbi:hypothetical protein ABIF68_004751 [Bradyrhizobium japonicum]|uniref:hypothetical protein n=1 Tax=Bradyrhizobium TaxID=374 RepID=UPI0012FDE5A9|nr:MULTISPECIES: hypothetical protein [Bradyrhizobium]MDI2077607.1 hypothetical protein [Bradyrhizobium sp. Mp27]
MSGNTFQISVVTLLLTDIHKPAWMKRQEENVIETMTCKVSPDRVRWRAALTECRPVNAKKICPAGEPGRSTKGDMLE